ncbi:SDR family oxidoreductase [Amycolatopsis sp. FDAARGOS 1241]|uniref:SDR family oxidoreductase n=1 Tax=Amycolatopsis sp. FDAARGOS 1241 TaxID=2778070 RepID=UPI001EF23D99|nr:NAD(P)H-binding protein [Amycolatopsis sp. FDAARGOS 1241]
MILVLGATGKVGCALVPALLDAGAPVRALTRDPRRHLIDPRAEVVRGDLDDTAALPRLLDGVRRVFVLTPGHGGDGAAQESALAHAAARTGVRHLVKLPTTGVHFGQTDPITRAHARAERAIRATGPAWTILRPGTFMDNRRAWLQSARAAGAVHVPEGDPASALIHPRDIAAVATLVLTTPGHEVRPTRSPAARRSPPPSRSPSSATRWADGSGTSRNPKSPPARECSRRAGPPRRSTGPSS